MRYMGWALAILASAMVEGDAAHAQAPRKLNVAHRGASAYAPEHTLAAYRLAIEQGADFVEQDLAVTKDGVLICLHDASLERTTDVEQRFPSRFTEMAVEGARRKAWLANDFTLAEIKTLDAGSWFDPKFAGERVPTFDEAVALIKGKAGLYPELKTPEIYEGRDVDFVALVDAALDRLRLRGPGADPRTPVILQTFGESTARALSARKIGVPIVLLFDMRGAFDPGAMVATWKGVVSGFGPAKGVLTRHPAFVRLAHEAGLTVTPYTFRSASTPGYPTVEAEMRHFLYTLDADALFTDNPDRFPRTP
jgi:glycerophosphoryl diester phosphodiesterase